MSGASHDEVKKHVRTYLVVFCALGALTLVTVGISYLPLSRGLSIALALFVAAIKGSLVAAFFMHLISEKRVIYSILLLTVIFFFTLLLIPVLA
jgi:cytochrome c oxidase subunit IV